MEEIPRVRRDTLGDDEGLCLAGRFGIGHPQTNFKNLELVSNSELWEER